MMRLAVLSDIHGNLPALEAVVADARAAGCDAFVNLGDTLSGPLWPRETAEWLMARDWPTIAGNHERQLLTLPPERIGAADAFARSRLDDRHLAWLATQPATLAYAPDVLLCHGTPDDDCTHLLFTVEAGGLRAADDAEIAARAGGRRERLILCGHTHVARIADGIGGRRIANPGSVGLQAYADDHPAPYRVEVGDPAARYAIVEDGAVHLRRADYDHEAAAAKAEREGRPDWARGLRFGVLGTAA